VAIGDMVDAGMGEAEDGREVYTSAFHSTLNLDILTPMDPPAIPTIIAIPIIMGIPTRELFMVLTV